MEKTLFERLGGRAGIAAIVDDVVVAHMENPTIRARFLPYVTQPDRIAVIKQHMVNFLDMGGGGGATYGGRSMRDAHTGMNISAEEFVAALDDILTVLERHRIDQQTRQDVLGIAYSLKNEVVRL